MSCTDARAQRSSNCFSPPVGAFAVALSAVLLLYITLWSPNFNAPVPGGDYLHFYLAARIVRDGEADRLYDFDYQLQFQNDPSFLPSASGEYLSALYIYPPFFVWFCQPFALLPFKA